MLRPDRAVTAFMCAWAGCGIPGPTQAAQADVAAVLESVGLTLEPSTATAVPLRYRPPTDDCPHTYVVRSEHAPALAHEPDTPSFITLTAQASERGAIALGHLDYQGVRAENKALTREWALTSRFAGPAAPTAACTPKTWDPVEDFFALAFPALPDRLTGIGESWTGLRVEGRCNRSACVDPQTGGGGPEVHDRACVTMSWRETLRGSYRIDGEPYVWLTSTWNDGQGPAGIRTTREVLLSPVHGRPVWGRTRIDYPWPTGPTRDDGFAPVVRTWTFASIDDCPGSLPALGRELAGEANPDAARERAEQRLRDRPPTGAPE